MQFNELVELAESIYPNVDLKMNNKELWPAIIDACELVDVPGRFRVHLWKIIWIMAKLDQDASKQKLSD